MNVGVKVFVGVNDGVVAIEELGVVVIVCVGVMVVVGVGVFV